MVLGNVFKLFQDILYFLYYDLASQSYFFSDKVCLYLVLFNTVIHYK